MTNPDSIKKLIRTKTRRLQKLQEKEALYGISTEASILIEIEDLTAEIAALKQELRAAVPPPELSIHPEGDNSMTTHNTPEPAESWLALLAQLRTNLHAFERKAAQKAALQIGFELRNQILQARQERDALLNQLQAEHRRHPQSEQAATLLAAERDDLQAEIEHLQAIKATRGGNIEHQQAVVAGYGARDDAPLKEQNLLKAEEEAVIELDTRLQRAKARLAELELVGHPPPPPQNLDLTLVTPDGARYAAAALSDLMAAQLLGDFLAEWQLPQEPAEPVRYALCPAPDAPPLLPDLTLEQAGVKAGATLWLTVETLTPTAAVGLVVEDAADNAFTAVVSLDTVVGHLAEDFMTQLGEQRQMAVQLLKKRQPRILNPEKTLFDEKISDGARLRISPVAV